MAQMAATASPAPASGPAGNLRFDDASQVGGDNAAFRQAMDRQQSANAIQGISPAGKGESLGQVMANRAAGLAGEIQKDQKYVSGLLEKASTSGDSMQLMRAMMALNDYQLKVQTVSKVVSKASSSVDSLTKLQ